MDRRKRIGGSGARGEVLGDAVAGLALISGMLCPMVHM